MGRLSQRRGLGTVATASLVVIALALVGLLAAGIVYAFTGTDTIDRSGPAVVERLRKVERFTAAEQPVTAQIDIEKDNILPDFVSGERVIALADGRVRATIDLSQVDDDAVRVSDDGRSVTLNLPEPELEDVQVDHLRVVSQSRGLVERASDFFAGVPFDDQELTDAAKAKLNSAAAKGDALDGAKQNAERWFEVFLGAAGFEDVTVNWVRTPA